MKYNRLLTVAALVLFALSAFSYQSNVRRAERFERGQKFLSNLNPDEIARIEIQKASEQTVLRRDADGERFVIPSADGYRAKNQSVNRFLKDVLGISLDKEIGSGDDLAQELGVAGADDATEVAFKNASDQEMVRFVIGKNFEDGNGTYVRRLGDDDTIYLTDARIFLSTGVDDFLDKQILDVQRSEIQSVTGVDFAMAKAEDGGTLVLTELAEGKEESSAANQIKGALQGLRFSDYHLANASEVQGLIYDYTLEYVLDDGSGYVLETAQKGDDHYLRATGFHTAGRISIAEDASEEEVKETSEVLVRADEIAQWNAFHGSWVYEIDASTAEKLRKTRSDLVEG